MKKQKTLLIVVLIVAIVMVGLYVAMGLMDKGEGKETTQTTDDSKVMLTDLENVTYVQYTNEEGTVTLVKEGELWTSEEEPELVLVEGYVTEKVDALSQISGTIVKDAKKEDCGLDEPIYTLVVDNGTESVKLYIGCDEDGNYCAMIDGKNDIYSIKESVVNILKMNIDSYAEIDDDMTDYYSNLDAESDDTEVESSSEYTVDDTGEELGPDDTTDNSNDEGDTTENQGETGDDTSTEE